MSNAVVYSINSINEKFENSNRFRQLLYSVSTLRRFNKDIKVYVYISDNSFLVNAKKYKSLNIDFIYFNSTEHITKNLDYDNSNNVKMLWHRWENTFKTFKNFNYDNIIFIDTDTVFYDDVEKLFLIYGNSKSIYTREDNCYEIMKTLGVDNNGLNAGQILFNKSLIFTEKELFNFMKFYINIKLNEMKPIMSKEMYEQTLWVIDQYAIYEYYKSIDIPIKLYDKKHVMLHLEPWSYTPSELILHHYLNSNYKVAVPVDFRNDDLSERFLNERI